MKIFTKFWFDEIEIKSTAYWNRFCQFLGVSKKIIFMKSGKRDFWKNLKIFKNFTMVKKINFDPKSIFTLKISIPTYSRNDRPVLVKWSASSRWSSFLNYLMRNSDAMTIGKTHTTLKKGINCGTMILWLRSSPKVSFEPFLTHNISSWIMWSLNDSSRDYL